MNVCVCVLISYYDYEFGLVLLADPTLLHSKWSKLLGNILFGQCHRVAEENEKKNKLN